MPLRVVRLFNSCCNDFISPDFTLKYERLVNTQLKLRLIHNHQDYSAESQSLLESWNLKLEWAARAYLSSLPYFPGQLILCHHWFPMAYLLDLAELSSNMTES